MKEKFLLFIETTAPKLLGAVIVLVVGIVAIKFLMNILKKAFKKSKIDPICHKFILSLLRFTLYIVLFITTLTLLSVPMTPFVALLSVAGLAVSLAVQGSLANLAGGFILLFTKPFNVGDFIEIENVSGTVKHINILQTKLLTFDNKAIFIPNGQVSEAKIVNFSAQDTRRLDLKFAIGYKEDFKKAQALIGSIVEVQEFILKDPEPVIRVCELSPSSVNIAVKVWVSTDNFWTVNYDLLEQVKTAFDEENITIPFNQLDVNLNQTK